MLKYSINRPITNVVVFGCGGTGSRTVPLLAQLLTSHEFTKNVRLVLVDGDVVEEKNCKRQHFIKQEIDRNKAEVLARRYRLGFEARTEAVPFFVPSVEEQMKYLRGFTKPSEMGVVQDATRGFFKAFSECFSPAGMDQSVFLSPETFESSAARNGNVKGQLSNTLFSNTSVFIMCVDSVDARKRIMTLIQTLGYMFGVQSRDAFPNMIVIDSGNEDIFGQVSYFNPVVPTLCPFPELIAEIPDRAPYSVGMRYVPFPIGRYMNMKDGESTKSCADLDQTLAINNMMAAMIAMVFQNILYGLEMDYHTINCNLNGSFYTEKMNLPWLKGVISTDPHYMRAVAEQMLCREMSAEDMNLLHGVSSKPGGAIHTIPMYFGMDRGVPSEGVGVREFFPNGMSTKVAGSFPVGSRLFLGTGEREADLRQFSDMPPCSAIQDEVFHMWKYSDFAHTNWANLVWPVLLKGLDMGYTQITDSIKRHAVACSAFTLGQAAISKSADESAIYGMLETNYNADVCDYSLIPARPILSMNRSDLVSFGKQDISSPSYRELLEKAVGVNVSFLGRKKILLPQDPTKGLVAGCNLVLNTYNNAQSSQKYVLSPYLVICGAILKSMTPREIRSFHSYLAERFTEVESSEKKRVSILMRKVESMILDKMDFLNTVSAVIGERGGVTLAKKDRWGYMTSHTKGVTALYDYDGGMFGGSIQDAKYIITHMGNIVYNEDLGKITATSAAQELKSMLETA